MSPITEEKEEMDIKFVPKSEGELIDYAIWLKSDEENSIIFRRWFLGTRINDFYEKKYGKDELQNIADASGYSKSTIYKSCQFANNYTEENLNKLFGGIFTISWRDIAQNLMLNPDEFVKVYLASQDINEFRNIVTDLKDGNESESREDDSGSSRKTRVDLEVEIESYVQQLKQKDSQIADLETQLISLQTENSELKEKLAQYEKGTDKSQSSTF
jgi:hypothetical protein